MTSPLDVPDLVGCASANDTFVSISGFCDPFDISIYDPNYLGAHTQTIGPTNACIPGKTIVFQWQNSGGDGIINILSF